VRPCDETEALMALDELKRRIGFQHPIIGVDGGLTLVHHFSHLN